MLAVGTLLLLVALCGVAVRHVDSRRQPVLVAASLAPVFMAASIPGTLALLGTPVALVGIAVIAACVATRLPLYRRRRRLPVDVTVMQANILLGRADPRAVVDAVDRRGVDVLTVIELTRSAVDGLVAAGLDERLPYRYVSPASGGEGTGIWSRHRLVELERHDGFITELLSARIELPTGRSPLIFAVHPVPPWPRHPSAWFRELGLLRELLAKIPVEDGPVIVSGDFNATVDHKRYRDLLGTRFRDTASGVQRTYASDRWYPAIIGIDHIVVSGGVAVDAGVVPLPGSDHHGVWARISLSDLRRAPG